MSREWKPGDVAWIKGQGMDTLAVRTAAGYWVWVDKRGSNPSAGGVCLCSSDMDEQARPLVVIDPEGDDDPTLYDIADYVWQRIDGGSSSSEVRQLLSAALREFANPTPPRPEEPTGLGAVVEDAEGVRWVRGGKSLPGQADDWRCVEGERVGWWAEWRNITAVKVLSDGVQP